MSVLVETVLVALFIVGGLGLLYYLSKKEYL